MSAPITKISQTRQFIPTSQGLTNQPGYPAGLLSETSGLIHWLLATFF
jgi:hypothetical protein